MAHGGQVLPPQRCPWPGTCEAGTVRIPHSRHASPRRRRCSRELGDERQGARRRPEPGADARRCGWPASTHLVDIGRIAELRGIERSNGSLVVGAATTDVAIERDAPVAAAVPLLTQGDAVDRPLPDPQPGHGRRVARPRRPGRRVPGGGAGPRCRRFDVAVRRRRAHDPGRRVLRRASGRRRWSPTSCSPRVDFPVWDGRCGFGVAEFARRHGDFAIAGAVAASALERERHRSSGAPSRCSAWRASPLRATAAEAAVVGQAAVRVAGRRGRSRSPSSDADEPPERSACATPGTAAGRRRRWRAKAWSEAVEEAQRCMSD